jgi:4-hydroxy-3-methylbut-2-enyl diphosphate reductase
MTRDALSPASSRPRKTIRILRATHLGMGFGPRDAVTACETANQRQTEANELARQCDVVIVVGGTHSSNTPEVVAECRKLCPRVYHVQNASDLRSVWFDGTETIGLTAGTSTPDTIIDEVHKWLEEFAQFQTKLADHLQKNNKTKES